MSARSPSPIFLSFFLFLHRQLLQIGARVDATGAESATALHHAVKGGQLGATRLLVKAGANLDAQDGSGTTALHGACFYASKYDLYNTMAEILIGAGANVHMMDELRCWWIG